MEHTLAEYDGILSAARLALNAHDPKPSLPSGLALIEKAQELRWTLQLAAAVLFADLVLAWRTGKGIAHWSAETDVLLANSGFLLVSALGFGVLMSIVMPLVAEFFRQVGWWLLIEMPLPDWMRVQQDYRRPVGAVLPGELRAYACRNNDRALLEMVSAHEEKRRKSIAEQLTAGQITFAVLVLGIVDFFPRLLGFEASTLLIEVPATFGPVGTHALVLAFVLGLLGLRLAWYTASPPSWIDYPPLYEELEKKRRERRLAE